MTPAPLAEGIETEWARGLAARAEENTSRKRKLALEAPVFAPSRRGASTLAKESAASSLRTRATVEQCTANDGGWCRRD